MVGVVVRSLVGALLVLTAGCAAAESAWTPPPPAPTAQQAAANFLPAVVDGRSGDAASVLSPEAVARDVGAGWLEDPPALTDIRWGEPRPDGAAAQYHPAYTDVTFVPVSFHVGASGDGFEEGDTAWGYIVGHSADDGWLILDNGAV